MLSSPKVVPVACLLWGMHAAVLLGFGTRGHGPLLSDLIQLALGLLTVLTVLGAAKRSDSFGRYFWRLTAFSFSILSPGQALAIGNQVAFASSSLPRVANFLFTFWFIPF